jgi:hypothetical protein
MAKNDIFWGYFKTTGQIGAYLLFRNMIGEYNDVSSKKLRIKRKLG